MYMYYLKKIYLRWMTMVKNREEGGVYYLGAVIKWSWTLIATQAITVRFPLTAIHLASE